MCISRLRFSNNIGFCPLLQQLYFHPYIKINFPFFFFPNLLYIYSSIYSSGEILLHLQIKYFYNNYSNILRKSYYFCSFVLYLAPFLIFDISKKFSVLLKFQLHYILVNKKSHLIFCLLIISFISILYLLELFRISNKAIIMSMSIVMSKNST